MSTTFTAPIRSPVCVAQLFADQTRFLQVERLWVMTLRADHTVIQTHFVREGETSLVRFKPREILRPAIVDEADVIVLVHNHPSGRPEPSPEDIEAWAQLKEACKHVGIKLLDSVIVAGDEWFSFTNEYRQEAE